MLNYTIHEASEYLKVSDATVRNWIRSGLLPMSQDNKRISKAELDMLYSKLSQSNRLRSRRNKSATNKRCLYTDYLSQDSSVQKSYAQKLQQLLTCLKSLSEEDINTLLPFILVEYSLQLLIETGKCIQLKRPYSITFLKTPKKAGIYAPLLKDLLQSMSHAMTPALTIEQTRLLLHFPSMPFLPYEDLLGWLYISLSNLGNRKLGGIYYTPAMLAKRLISSLPERCYHGQLLDPACGTGQFLLVCAQQQIPLSSLYGQDRDPVAVSITRINLSLNYAVSDLNILYQNITCADSLLHYPSCNNATVIGNPPWGSWQDQATLALLKNNYTLCNHATDTAALFIEAALQHQGSTSVISCLLPLSLLEVHLHKDFRQMILTKSNLIELHYLGNCFFGVDCPVVLLTIAKDFLHPGLHHLRVNDATHHYIIENRSINDADSLMLRANDAEYQLLQQITSLTQQAQYTTLAGQATFALGIVTGDNRRFLQDSPLTAKSEKILRGENLVPYGTRGPYSFIQYEPSLYQQCAREMYYRAKEKLLYRFIGNKIIFTYDNQQMLTLNSCNLLIPHIDGVTALYLLAVLNSRVAAFYLKKRFPSVKLLRRHLESLPIPIPDAQTQSEIESLVNLQITNVQNYGIMSDELNEQLNHAVNQLYGLTNNDIAVINDAISQKKGFI